MAIFSYAALGAQVKVSVLLKTVKLSVMGEQTWATLGVARDDQLGATAATGPGGRGGSG